MYMPSTGPIHEAWHLTDAYDWLMPLWLRDEGEFAILPQPETTAMFAHGCLEKVVGIQTQKDLPTIGWALFCRVTQEPIWLVLSLDSFKESL